MQERIEQLEQSLDQQQKQAQDWKEQKELNQRIILSLEKQLKEGEGRHLKAVENLKKEVYMANNRQYANKDEEFFIKELRETRKTITLSLDSNKL